MRLGFLLGLVLLACGGESDNAPPGDAGGGVSSSSMGDGGSGSKGGKASVSKPQGGSESAAGGAGTAGDAGAPAAGSSDEGGASGAAPSDGGASGAAAGDAGAGGEGGASTPAPDDTGCIERPWTGNQADLSEKVPGLDCSSCSNGTDLGYMKPAWCSDVASCGATRDVAELGADDVLILLPPGDGQDQSEETCKEQACAVDDDSYVNLPGFIEQLRFVQSTESPLRIDVDENRRVLSKYGPPLCANVSNCYAFGGGDLISIVVKPSAPRGWVRIRRVNEACE
jgi:hypothetical protein